jgi:NADH dehydrogenase
VTGASGFVGSHLIEELIERGHEVKALTRSFEKAKLLEERGCEAFVGDVTDPKSLPEFLRTAQVVVHLAATIRERGEETFERVNHRGTRNVVEAAKENNVEKIVYMSVLGSSNKAEHPFLRSRWRAEEEVRRSGIPYVILRPSLIVGRGGDMTNKIVRSVKKPIVVLPGTGENKVQPIYVKDVVRFLAKAVEEDKFDGRTFELGGPDRLDLDGLLELFMNALQIKKRILHVPAWLVAPFIRVWERFSELPLSSSELSLLQMDWVCDPSPASREFGLKLTPVEEALQEALQPRPEPPA